MNKKLIRLTESDLHQIVKECVNKILIEGYWDDYEERNDYEEKEKKPYNCYNPEKDKKEPSKSSRIRRREYIRNKKKDSHRILSFFFFIAHNR